MIKNNTRKAMEVCRTTKLKVINLKINEARLANIPSAIAWWEFVRKIKKELSR